VGSRIPLLLPLILCLVRLGHLRSAVGAVELVLLFAVGLLLPLLPLRRLLKPFIGFKARIGVILLIILVLVALFAPVVALHGPTETFPLPQCRYMAPLTSHVFTEGGSAFFPLGTDDFGRCVFSRLIYGSRVSLSIGILAMLLALTIGAVWGTVAGYAGGATDAVLMRTVDGLMAFPRLFLLILVVAVWPTSPSVPMVVLVLGFLSWMEVSRLVRGQILTLKGRDFVLASRQMGASHTHLMFRHLLPNAMGPVLVDATLRIGGTILVEAALSFLGLGVQPPTASWGNMIAAGKDVPLDAWWMTTFPGIAIIVTVMTFFLIGEGLQETIRQEE